MPELASHHNKSVRLMAFCIVLHLLALQVFALPAEAAGLDLSSTTPSINASQIPGFHTSSGAPAHTQSLSPSAATATIKTTNGAPVYVTSGNQLLTPAEAVALAQQLAGSPQTLQIDRTGAAVAGYFRVDSILSALNSQISSLVIPKGVTAVDALATNTPLSIAGQFTNSGSFFAVGLNNQVQTATINATGIVNNSGALLSTVLSSIPAGVLSGLNLSNLTTGLSLNLAASGSIANYGSIASAGNLSLISGGTVTNGPGAQIQAQNLLNINSALANIVNSGNITSIAGNINIVSQAVNNLIVNNIGGRISAIGGNINIRDALFSEKANTTLWGGDFVSNQLNVYSGKGAINVNADNITGNVNTTGSSLSLSAAGGNLNVGNVNITGDPVIYNSDGNIILNSPITTQGAPLAIAASGDVLTLPGNNTFPSISTAGGDILIAAGANIVPSASSASSVLPPGSSSASFTITGNSQTGGKIDFSTLSPVTSFSSANSGGAGGNITLIAYGGNCSNCGTITLPTNVAITSGGTGSGAANGNVLIIASSRQTSLTAITTGNINTAGQGNGATSAQTNTGSITLQTLQLDSLPAQAPVLGASGDTALSMPAQPNVGGSPITISAGPSGINTSQLVQYSQNNANASSNGSLNPFVRNESINTGSLTTDGANIQVDAGSNFLAQGSITASASNAGTGGTINLNIAAAQGASNTFTIGSNPVLSGVNGSITSLGGPNGGNGGTINVNGVLANILIQSAGLLDVHPTSGQGGNISLISGSFNPSSNNFNFAPYGSITLPGQTLDASARGTGSNNGGTITIGAGSIALTGPFTLTLLANGAGNGNGGSIYVADDQDSLPVGSGFPLVMHANSTGRAGNGGTLLLVAEGGVIVDPNFFTATPGSTNGNGGNFSLYSGFGNIVVNGALIADGVGNGQGGTIGINNLPGLPQVGGSVMVNGILSANGSGNGSGGTININQCCSQGPVTLTGNVSANDGILAGCCVGHGVNIWGSTISITGDVSSTNVICCSNIFMDTFTFTGTAGSSFLLVKGNLTVDSTNGFPGGINLQCINCPDMVLGPGALAAANGVTGIISAQGPNGGSINVTNYNGALTLQSYATLLFGASSGNGGSLILSTGTVGGVLTLPAGNLDASAVGSGNGGQILLTGSDIQLSGLGALSLAANGTFNGNGGQIELTFTAPASTKTINSSSFTFTATGGSNFGNGGIVEIDCQGDLIADPTVINVNPAPGSGGNGGTVTLTASSSITVNSAITVNGDTGGSGGNIALVGYYPNFSINNFNVNSQFTAVQIPQVSIPTSSFPPTPPVQPSPPLANFPNGQSIPVVTTLTVHGGLSAQGGSLGGVNYLGAGGNVLIVAGTDNTKTFEMGTVGTGGGIEGSINVQGTSGGIIQIFQVNNVHVPDPILLLANGFAGNGGQIWVITQPGSSSNITFETPTESGFHRLQANAGGSGIANGGIVWLSADGNLNLIPIEAIPTGDGSGNFGLGGAVVLSAVGAISCQFCANRLFGSVVEINAPGGADPNTPAGQGPSLGNNMMPAVYNGMISISSGQDFTVNQVSNNASPVSVDDINAVASGNNRGPDIFLTWTGSQSVNGALIVGGDLDASGSGFGGGGSITIQSGIPGGAVNPGNVNINNNLSANGGPSGGAGGMISVITYGAGDLLCVGNCSGTGFVTNYIAGTISATASSAAGGSIFVNGGSTGLAVTPQINGQPEINVAPIDGPAGAITLKAVDDASNQQGQVQLFEDSGGSPGAVTPVSASGDDSFATGNQYYGGAIVIQGSLIQFNGWFAISANGAGSGNGGYISVNSPTVTVTSGTVNSTGLLSLSASGAGNGGTVTLYSSDPLTVGTDQFGNQISIAATGGGPGSSGNGGTINLFSSTLTVDPSVLSYNPLGPSGQGATLNFSGGQLNILAGLIANGVGSGNGGSINLSAGQIFGPSSPIASPLVLTANAQQTSGGTGAGGTINLTVSNDSVRIGNSSTNANQDQFQINALGGATSGSGGNVTISTFGGPTNTLTVNVSFLKAQPTGTGNGGNYTLTTNSGGGSNGGDITITGGSLNASANSHGNGGIITVNSSGSLSVTNGGVISNGADSGFGGGTIFLASGSTLLVNGNVTAVGQGNGAGGNITLWWSVPDTFTVSGGSGGIGSNGVNGNILAGTQGANGGGGAILLEEQQPPFFPYTGNNDLNIAINGGVIDSSNGTASSSPTSLGTVTFLAAQTYIDAEGPGGSLQIYNNLSVLGNSSAAVRGLVSAFAQNITIQLLNPNSPLNLLTVIGVSNTVNGNVRANVSLTSASQINLPVGNALVDIISTPGANVAGSTIVVSSAQNSQFVPPFLPTGLIGTSSTDTASVTAGTVTINTPSFQNDGIVDAGFSDFWLQNGQGDNGSFQNVMLQSQITGVSNHDLVVTGSGSIVGNQILYGNGPGNPAIGNFNLNQRWVQGQTSLLSGSSQSFTSYSLVTQSLPLTVGLNAGLTISTTMGDIIIHAIGGQLSMLAGTTLTSGNNIDLFGFGGVVNQGAVVGLSFGNNETFTSARNTWIQSELGMSIGNSFQVTAGTLANGVVIDPTQPIPGSPNPFRIPGQIVMNNLSFPSNFGGFAGVNPVGTGDINVGTSAVLLANGGDIQIATAGNFSTGANPTITSFGGNVGINAAFAISMGSFGNSVPQITSVAALSPGGGFTITGLAMIPNYTGGNVVMLSGTTSQSTVTIANTQQNARGPVNTTAISIASPPLTVGPINQTLTPNQNLGSFLIQDPQGNYYLYPVNGGARVLVPPGNVQITGPNVATVTVGGQIYPGVVINVPTTSTSAAINSTNYLGGRVNVKDTSLNSNYGNTQLNAFGGTIFLDPLSPSNPGFSLESVVITAIAPLALPIGQFEPTSSIPPVQIPPPEVVPPPVVFQQPNVSNPIILKTDQIVLLVPFNNLVGGCTCVTMERAVTPDQEKLTHGMWYVADSACQLFTFNFGDNSALIGAANTQIAPGEGHSAQLRNGTVVVLAGDHGLAVNTAMGTVTLAKKSAAIIQESDNGIIRVSQLSGPAAQVEITRKGTATKFTTEPGKELLVADSSIGDEELIPVDGVGRTAIGGALAVASMNVKQNEFSPAEMARKNPLLNCTECLADFKKAMDKLRADLLASEDSREGTSEKPGVPKAKSQPGNSPSSPVSKIENSELLPIAFLPPQTESGVSSRFTSLTTDTAYIKHDQARISVDTTGTIHLAGGDALIITRKPTVVESGGHQFRLSPNTIVRMSLQNDRVQINVLYDARANSVRAQIGNRLIQLSVGQELIVGHSLDAPLGAYGTMGRRRVKRAALTGAEVMVSEFSIPTLLHSVEVVKSLTKSRSALDRHLVEKIVKVSACLMQSTINHGTFRQQ